LNSPNVPRTFELYGNLERLTDRLRTLEPRYARPDVAKFRTFPQSQGNP